MRTEQLDTLKKQVTDIALQQENHPLSETASIADRLVYAYHDYFTRQLNAVLKDDVTAEQLQQFLQSHWDEMRSTFFTYTALPHDPVTTLCCTIAVQLSEVTNLPALQLLMPRIETESHFPDSFPNLHAKTVEDLLSILRTHILSDDGKTLIPILLLRDTHPSLTDTPENAYPAIAIDADKIVNPYTNFHPVSSSELARLTLFNEMTRLLFESKQNYRDIAHDEDTLLGQLNKLASRLASNSAHGGRGTQAVAASGAFTAIVEFNRYYQQLSDEQKEALPENIVNVINTLLRLSETASRDFLFDEDGSDLPESLEPGTLYLRREGRALLCSLVDLHQNEIHGITLPVLVTDSGILDELVRLKHIAENKQFYIDRTDEMETCVGTQSENLRDALKADAELLSQVKLSGSVKAVHLTLQKRRYHHAQRSLASDPASRNGCDHYGVQLKALRLVDVQADFFVRSDVDLKNILLLEPPEITEICALPGVTHQIVSVIGTLENLVIWIGENQPDKLSVLLPLIARDLFAKKILVRYQDVSELLIALTPEKIEVVCQALQCLFTSTAHFEVIPGRSISVGKPRIDISVSNHFFHIMEVLDLNQSRALCAALPGILEESMRIVLHRGLPPSPDSLTSDQRIIVYRTLEDQWQSLVNTPKKFHVLMRFIPPALHAEGCEKFKSQLPGFIRNITELEFIFKCIQDDLHRASLLQLLIDSNQLIGWIESPYHLYSISEYCDADQFEKIYQGVKHKLASAIRRSINFCQLTFLNPDHQMDMVGLLDPNLESLIENATDFSSFFSYFDGDHFSVVCNRLKKHLFEKVIDVDDLFSVVQNFSLEKFTLFCDIFQDWLFTMLTLQSDRVLLFNALEDDHCEVMVKILADGLIRSVDDFCDVMQHLDESKRAMLFEVLKQHLSTLIHHPKEFAKVLVLLDMQQIKALCLLLKAKLHLLMRSHQDLHRSMGHLEINDRITVVMFFLKAITDNPRISFDAGKKDIYTMLEKAFLMACTMRADVARALKGNDCGKIGELSAKHGLFCANPFLYVTDRAASEKSGRQHTQSGVMCRGG